MLMADWEWTDFKFEATHVPFSRRKFSHKMKIVRDAAWISTPPAAGAVRGPALLLHAPLCGSPAGRKTPQNILQQKHVIISSPSVLTPASSLTFNFPSSEQTAAANNCKIATNLLQHPWTGSISSPCMHPAFLFGLSRGYISTIA